VKEDILILFVSMGCS